MRAYHATESYKKAMRKRAVWIEPRFGEAKQWHGLRQFRLRGLRKVNTEGLLTAAGQNLKRWLVATGWGRRHAPGGALTPPRCAHQTVRHRCPGRSAPCRRPGPSAWSRLRTHAPVPRGLRHAAFVTGLTPPYSHTSVRLAVR